MRYSFILMLLCLVLLPVQAQSDWQVVVYVEDTTAASYSAQLQIFTPQGRQEHIPLPETLGAPDAEFTLGAFVSDDLRFVALYQSINNSRSPASLRIYNRGTGECCYDISAKMDGAIAFNFAGFAPNGSGLAFSYIKNTFPQPDSGGIMFVDAATGIISQDIPMSVIKSNMPVDDFATWAMMGDWTEGGIYFIPFCYACDGFLNGEYSLYHFQTGAFTANSGVYPGDRLASTGELLYTEHDRRYSYSMAEGMFPAFNVVQYSISGSPSPDDPVIFASEDIINIRDIAWVADGNAILVEAQHDTGLWQLVWRDGRSFPMMASGLTQRGGTPTGWLGSRTNNDGSELLIHYDAVTLEATDLVRFESGTTYRIVQRPALGENLTALPFVTVQPPARPVTYCPNFVPSRLVVGDRARVTPGDPNRLRAQAVSGDVIGSIPGGGEFTVIGEPFCDSFEGILWWEVDYQGLVGWTAEGQGSTYWLEPIVP